MYVQSFTLNSTVNAAVEMVWSSSSTPMKTTSDPRIEVGRHTYGWQSPQKPGSRFRADDGLLDLLVPHRTVVTWSVSFSA